MGMSSRSRRRAARWAAVVVVLVVGLSGCSSGGSLAVGRLPSHTASASVAASAMPSPPPTKVLSPQDEAVATVRQFFEALTTASTTGNTAPAVRLSDRRCSCRAVLSDIEHDFAQGRRAIGGEWSINSLKFFAFDGAYAYLDLNYSVAAYRVLDATGKVLNSYASHRTTGEVRLIRSGSTWQVLEITRDSTS